jgi:hypothetical protein
MNRRPIARTLVAALSAITLVLSSVPAVAAPSASDKETARALMKDGETKREKGDHKSALQSFHAAHAIMNVPTTGLELGRSQMDLGLLVEARDTLLGVTRLPVLPGESANMPAAREEAQALADEIEPRIPTLTINLVGVPPGTTAKVSVDDHPILAATIGVPRKHNPGEHVIAVVAGSIEKKQAVVLAEGDTKELTIDLHAPELDRDEPAMPSGDEPSGDARAPNYSLMYIGIASAGVFGVVGGVTGLLAFSRAGAARDGCDGNRCPPSTHDQIESSKTFGTVSTISFALAGAGAVVAVIGFVTARREPSAFTESRTAPSLRLTIGGTGVALIGWF